MLSLGIVGLPNVGKSTLFQAVTNKHVDIQNYPFTTIEPNVGVVEVPDPRVDALTQLSHSARSIYATVQFTDIAGLVKGASQGEGLGNKFLANIREVDAIVHVVRAFHDDNVLHVHSRIDPIDDIAIINTELVMTDAETLAKRLEKTQKEGRADKKAAAQLPLLEHLIALNNAGTVLSGADLSDDEKALARELNLLSAKPFLYVLNVSEQQLTEGWQPSSDLRESLHGAPFVVMCNAMELALSTMSAEDKKELLASVGKEQSGLDELITLGYRRLGLLTFLTTGETESRAWTAHEGDPIPVASRAIHTDFERLFIRAEVIPAQQLLEVGGYGPARAKGLVKTVGRDYIIQDGDVVEILIGK